MYTNLNLNKGIRITCMPYTTRYREREKVERRISKTENSIYFLCVVCIICKKQY